MGDAHDIGWNLVQGARPIAEIALTGIWKFLNTSFSAALFGALGGSWSAYWLGVRNDRRNKLREEIAATNNAIGMTMNIMNMMLSMKEQHVKPISERYAQQFMDYFLIEVSPVPPPGAGIFVIQTNFQILSMPQTMIGDLQRTIIERVTRSTYAQMLIGSLQRVLAALDRTLEIRTQIINHMRQVSQPIQKLAYFGLPDSAGNVDDTFPDTLTAITQHVDECIYYCELLMEILTTHGAALRKAYGRKAAKIVTIDLSDPRVASLLPDRSRFSDFERQFRAPKKPAGWDRARAWVIARVAGADA